MPTFGPTQAHSFYIDLVYINKKIRVPFLEYCQILYTSYDGVDFIYPASSYLDSILGDPFIILTWF
jgi:hypothetical protein